MRGFPDNDYLLLRDEPGYRGGEPSDDDEPQGLVAPAPMRMPERLPKLIHVCRGAHNVRASFTLDTTTGTLTRCAP